MTQLWLNTEDGEVYEFDGILWRNISTNEPYQKTMTKLTITRESAIGAQPIESMTRGDVFEYGGDIFQRTGAADKFEVYSLTLQKISDMPAGTQVSLVPAVDVRLKF